MIGKGKFLKSDNNAGCIESETDGTLEIFYEVERDQQMARAVKDVY